MNLSRFRSLGQPASDAAAWEAYLTALRDNLTAKWSGAVAAYQGLKTVRQNLGLPFMVEGAGPESTGAGKLSASAWSPDLDQQAVDLMAMVTLIKNALDDTIAGKRKLNYSTDRAEFLIEGLPADLLRLEVQGEKPVLILNATNQPAPPIQGQVSAPAIVWAATLGVSVLALPAYWVVEKAVNTLTDVAEQKTMKTLAEKSYECVQTGKCTPEQAAKLNQSIYSGAAAVRAEKVREKEAASKPTTDITSAIKTVALVALGIAAIYAIIKFVPASGARRMAPRRTALALRSAA
jgi:hypothetical protein